MTDADIRSARPDDGPVEIVGDAGARVTPRERALSSSGQNASGTRPSPSRSVPSACSGCGRRTDSKRRTSVASVASRKTSCGVHPMSRSRCTAVSNSVKNCLLRTSTTAAILIS